VQAEEEVMKRVADLAKAHSLSDDQVDLYRDVFRMLDVDGSQAIGTDELVLGLRSTGKTDVKVTQQKAPTDRRAQQLHNQTQTKKQEYSQKQEGIMLYDVVSCCIMLYHVVSCCIMLYHAVSCCMMLYHVASCCIMLHDAAQHNTGREDPGDAGDHTPHTTNHTPHRKRRSRRCWRSLTRTGLARLTLRSFSRYSILQYQHRMVVCQPHGPSASVFRFQAKLNNETTAKNGSVFKRDDSNSKLEVA
jgi:hypothetical protein